jgi:2-dehydropantoate 2-reductase
MGQDMQKGRRTEIDFLNGLVVREGEKVGIACRANAVLTDLVTKVERGELKADPRHITELRLNQGNQGVLPRLKDKSRNWHAKGSG